MNRDDFRKSVQGELDFRRQAFDRKALEAFTQSVWPVASESADDTDFWAAEFLLWQPDPAVADRAEMYSYCCFWLAVLSPILMGASYLLFTTCTSPAQSSTFWLIGSVLCWLVSIGFGTSVAYHGQRPGRRWSAVGMAFNGVWGLALCYQALTEGGTWHLLSELLR